NILARERADVAHVAIDLVRAIALNEKTLQSRRRNIFFDSAGKNSQPRMFDYRFTQIGAENLDAYFGRPAAERLQNAYRERINFFAGGATRHPRAQLWLSIFAFIFEQRRQETFLQCAEEGVVPEKPGHVDEQIVKKRFDLFFVIAQEPRVLTHLFYSVQRHPSLYSTDQRALFIGAEIDTHLFSEREKDAAQIVRLAIGCFFYLFRIAQQPPDIRMIGDALDLARNFPWREDKIDKPRANRAPRHRIELRALFTLGEGQSAGRFDCAQPGGAIAAGPGENDANRTRSTFFGERFKKMIDRNVQPFLASNQCQRAILGDDAFVRRLDVDRVRFWRRRSRNLAHWHRRNFAEQIGKPADVVRIEMLHNHKSHSRFLRQVAQEFHRRFKAAGRTADSHNRAGGRGFLFFPGAVGPEMRFGFTRNRSS